MNRREVYGSILVIAIMFTCFASAEVKVNSQSIRNNYVAGENISGIINLNITSENSNSLITDNFGNSISLIDFFVNAKLEEELDYSCTNKGCGSKYFTKGALNNQDIMNNSIYGFNLIGSSVSISLITGNITSNTASSCTSQLSVDFMDMSEYIVNNNNFEDSACASKNYGCFNINDNTEREMAIIEAGGELCEKINIKAGPAYRVGAKVKNSSEGSGTITMRMYDLNQQVLGDCELPGMNQSEQDLSCIIPRPGKDEEVFVCATSNRGNYQIRIEDSLLGPVCGSDDLNSGIGEYDYEIFAFPLRYGPLNYSLESDFAKISDFDLAEYANNYLADKYYLDESGNINCSKGCAIPFTFKSNVAQNVKFLAKARYRDRSTTKETSQLYELGKESSKLSGNNIEADIRGLSFSIPLNSNSKIFELYFDGKLILNKSINITRSFDFDVNPKFAYPGIETKFVITGATNISSVKMKVDGITIQENSPLIKYTFLEEGLKNLEFEVSNSAGVIRTKSFDIIVGNASSALKQLINETESRIKNIQSAIDSVPIDMKKRIEQRINLSSKISEFNIIKQNQNKSENESIDLIIDIIELRIPQSVGKSEQSILPLGLGFESMDTTYIENISGLYVSGQEKEKLKGNIIYWINKNYNPQLFYNTFDIVYNSVEKEEISYGEIIFNKKGNYSEDYLIVNPVNNIEFIGNINPLTLGGEETTVYGFKISENKISFIIDGKPNLEELGIYISPKIQELGFKESANYIPPTIPKKRLWTYIILLIIGFFALYITLQEWYKKRYENFLFKSKDELYNLISAIYNMRAQGMNDEQIKKILYGQKWSWERVLYAFKKLDGKRTGMYEIPVLKFLEKRNVKKELAKRAPNTSGGRFIKQGTI